MSLDQFHHDEVLEGPGGPYVPLRKVNKIIEDDFRVFGWTLNQIYESKLFWLKHHKEDPPLGLGLTCKKSDAE
jgi:hypothetical protein